MLFYVVFFGCLPTLVMFYVALAIASIADFLYPIIKAVLTGIAAIILIPRLLSAAPVIIVLVALVALVNGVKRIIG